MVQTGKERKAIKVASVAAPRKAGKGEVLPFKGGDGIFYDVWSNELKALVQVGAELDSDVIHSSTEKDGQVYVHHRIDQIYIDGKPVKQPYTGPRGNFSKGYDPLERPSIEAQTAYNGIIQLLVHKIIDMNHKNAQKATQWAEKKLEANLQPPPSNVISGKANEAQQKPNPETIKNGEFKNVGQLLTAVSKLGISRATFMELLHCSEEDLPKVDLREAWEAMQDYAKNKKGGKE